MIENSLFIKKKFSALALGALLMSAMPSSLAVAEQTRPSLTGKPYTGPTELDTTLPRDYASDLPDLGDIAQTVLSPLDEQRIADQIMRQVYVSDDVLQDPEITDYLQALGNKLAAASPDKRQTFNFFVVNDNTINAFAMPGGVIGVHTGLFIAANNESELASVLGHEIGHVTQRHLARILASQKYDTFKNIATTALALLVARSNPQLASGAMVTASASNIQRQLDYTREHEREADRVGLAILDNAGFDVRAMPAFFTTMQRGTRFVEGSAPSFLRTHPLTAERIADVSNRVQALSYKQSKDSLDFYLTRAKIRAGLGFPQSAIDEFENNIRERRFNSETAEHYGLAYAYLRKNDMVSSAKQLAWLKANAAPHPNFEQLAATIEMASSQFAKAQAIYSQAIVRYPMHRAIVYGYADSYLDNKQPDKAVKLVNEKLRVFPNDGHLYEMLAKAYSMKGQDLLRHQAQAEAYYRKYDVNRAVEQMELASKAKDGNFYERSIVEARLKELRRQQGIEKELKG